MVKDQKLYLLALRFNVQRHGIKFLCRRGQYNEYYTQRLEFDY